jgi:hypothetical protein
MRLFLQRHKDPFFVHPGKSWCLQAKAGGYEVSHPSRVSAFGVQKGNVLLTDDLRLIDHMRETIIAIDNIS